MSSELKWRCRACGCGWIADFTQIACVSCGDEKVSLDEHERVVRRRTPNICMGDIILGGFAPPEPVTKGQ